MVFAAASVGVKPFSNLRSFGKIAKVMRALNPEIVVSGQAAPGVKILADMDHFYTLLIERVRAMLKSG